MFPELLARTNFSFLHGASHPQEMVESAKNLALSSLGICDTNTTSGLVRAHVAAKTAGLKFIPGSRLTLVDVPEEIGVLPRTRSGYAELCKLLTLGKRRAGKGGCYLELKDVLENLKQCEVLACLENPCTKTLKQLKSVFGDQLSLVISHKFDGYDQVRLKDLTTLSEATDVPLIAANQPILHHSSRRPLADVLACLRLGRNIDNLGREALQNEEACLKDLEPLYKAYPEALERAKTVEERCDFSLDELRYEYPDEITPRGQSPQERLRDLCDAGLKTRYPEGPPTRVLELLSHELKLIDKLDYAPYFLTVEDVVSFAKSQGILCQGRGSAANSVVCYLMGITQAPPDLISMVFERFVSEARNEPPDIDVDFEHERREEVIQYIYNRFGRHRSGLCATVTHYRSRMAIREVGKVMGLSDDVISKLNSHSWSSWSHESPTPDLIKKLGLNPEERRLKLTLELVSQIVGFPRHLGQHVGGFIITRGRLDELCVIENAAMEDRTVIEWDKDDIEALGILKVDILALGMLTALRKSFDMLRQHEMRDLSLSNIPPEDPEVYEMLCQADSIGVFQVESRAQMAFLPRMKPRKFYDLVIEVAIVRPGPIQGGMVHPYLKRRNGEEEIDYPSEALKEVLGKTLGVPLFQEQAMQIAITGAGFTPSEADGLRRAMATFRKNGEIGLYAKRFIQGMVDHGYDIDFAARCFKQIEGFGEYGFPESHAASFAYLVYASAWMKKHYPAIFTCSLLNSQPMGFYAPAQLVRDVREHGVEVLPVCINHSQNDHSLERNNDGKLSIRLGFRQIKGLSHDDANWIVSARGNGYNEPEDVWRRAGLSPSALTKLAEADAFSALHISRRDALWAIAPLKAPDPLPLFDEGEDIKETKTTFPIMSEGEQVLEDYTILQLTLRSHPIKLLRSYVPKSKNGSVKLAQELQKMPTGTFASVCGLVLTRQRPGTASGVVFVTLEDESGSSNIVIWPSVYEKFKQIVINARFMKIEGKLEKQGLVVHLIAETITDLSPMLHTLPKYGRNGNSPTEKSSEKQRIDALMADVDKAISYEDLGNQSRIGSQKIKSKLNPRRPARPRKQPKTIFPSRDFF